ncbi:hypothetical protein EVAR_50695_1 [Eumeta japonica]|uniref:Uncharacterized protein n=1 Tax=Eumeta variegata TaxID=151549 RepID=A0A4C1YMJ0_EUMVA|nr:hypothetical protein EVAR_50695_1 [Eumeta japonica]
MLAEQTKQPAFKTPQSSADGPPLKLGARKKAANQGPTAENRRLNDEPFIIRRNPRRFSYPITPVAQRLTVLPPKRKVSDATLITDELTD